MVCMATRWSIKFEDMITRFDTIHECDTQQDGRTDGQIDGRTDPARRHRSRLCTASRCKTRPTLKLKT